MVPGAYGRSWRQIQFQSWNRMSFDWSSYLTLAKELSNKVDEFPDQEAVYRSVVSRAYYSVFCLARNYVRDVDRSEFHGNAHKELQDYLKNHPHRPRKKIGNQLRDLHQHRLKADYDDDLGEQPQNKASRAVALANKIITGLADIYS